MNDPEGKLVRLRESLDAATALYEEERRRWILDYKKLQAVNSELEKSVDALKDKNWLLQKKLDQINPPEF